MNIAIVAKELAPFIDESGRGAEITNLANEFVSRGHKVLAVIPYPGTKELSAHSLARRLNPIAFSVGDRQLKCVRYDGRTSSGVAVHLLEVVGLGQLTEKDGWRTTQSELFGAAASALIAGLGEAPDWCLSFDEEASSVPANLKNLASHVLVVSSPPGDNEALKDGLSHADKVVIANRETAAAVESRKLEPLASMIAEGKAFTLTRPRASFAPLGLDKKESLKAAFQLKNGLPIRKDAPLVLFAGSEPPLKGALKEFLRGNVQVAAFCKDDALRDLAGLYPDRLKVVDRIDSWDEALKPVDACVVGSNAALVEDALVRSVVPVVGPAMGVGLVDMEPSCESGSAIVADNESVEALADGLNRLAAAFTKRAAFRQFAGRLPGFVPTWSKIVGHYLEIMEDGASESSEA